MSVLPGRGISFVEFSLVFSPIRDQLAWTQLADDFLQAKELLFMDSSTKPIASYAFAVQDKSSGTTSSFSLSVQMHIKSSKANSLAQFVESSLSDFLEALKRKFPGKYDDVQNVEFEGTPTIIALPVPVWLRILEIGCVIVVGLICVVLGIKYRKTIVQKFKFRATRYREERRAQIMEDLNLPPDMYFDPQSPKAGITVFETPYGNVCEAIPIPVYVPNPQGTFVEA